MGIRLVRMDQPGAVDVEMIWEYLQACRSQPQDDAAGLGPLEDCHSLDEVRRSGLPEVARQARGDDLPPGFVPALQFAALDPSGKLVGMIQLRLQLTQALLRTGGNIGYSVRPDCRRQGYAGLMLDGCLRRAAALGMRRVLITCSPSNLASRRTILSCGGQLENVLPSRSGQPVERYWIELSTESTGQRTRQHEPV
ncbi:GNAT family N-acetyltransferase [Bifidobacterium asteroides]|uniref:GCN5-related N-acetyltransferase n=1 Tax=Bifidobacterium asteroides TaxID=1684 RepID=A0A2N3R9A0_9BIFI|nr:GNAT family N-acetyltransferase [Bifidobacterium asteroides]PKV08565.1 GCN5-related N-acetyltransferase [Bifidobacterium asteroides]